MSSALFLEVLYNRFLVYRWLRTCDCRHCKSNLQTVSLHFPLKLNIYKNVRVTIYLLLVLLHKISIFTTEPEYLSNVNNQLFPLPKFVHIKIHDYTVLKTKLTISNIKTIYTSNKISFITGKLTHFLLWLNVVINFSD